MKAKLCLVLAFLLLLTGCSWNGQGAYLSVSPHREDTSRINPENVVASNYRQLFDAMTALVESCAESGLIYVPDYGSKLESDLKKIIRYLSTSHPIGAYALDQAVYEIGTGSGQQAVAIELKYLHDISEIRRIKQCATMDEAKAEIAHALYSCTDKLVIQIESYHHVDFVQLLRDYAYENPSEVMELPDVSVGVYPENGSQRVVELKFNYQTSRDSLRSMQAQVRPIFDAAVLYVSGDGEDREKMSQLYAFLMERFNYQYDTSITPVYSLLRHGVGDSMAFAVVYSAMCRNAGLDCRIVSGTRNAEAWYWNIVRIGERYYHVDLLESAALGNLQTWNDDQMTGYVWDYFAYPACTEPEETTE